MTTLTIAVGVAALFFMCAFIAIGVMLVCATKELTRVVKGMNQDEPKIGKVKFVGPGATDKPKSNPRGGRFVGRRNPPRRWNKGKDKGDQS